MAMRSGHRGSTPIEHSRVSIRCAFCVGTGRDPFGPLYVLFNCRICMGQGNVEVFKPTLHCLAFGGRGVVTVIEPSKEYPTCQGRSVVLPEGQ